MLACLASDLNAIFTTNEFGVTVTHSNGTTAVGMLDDASELMQNFGQAASQVIGQHMQLIMPTAAMVVAQGDVLTINGTAYTVTQRMLVGDGDITHYLLGARR